MIPTIRTGSRAIGLSGWLAAFHPDKYNSVGPYNNVALQQTNNNQEVRPAQTQGLFGTTASIWNTATPAAGGSSQPQAARRDAASEVCEAPSDQLAQQMLGFSSFLPSPAAPKTSFAYNRSVPLTCRQTVQAEQALQAAALAQAEQAAQAAVSGQSAQAVQAMQAAQVQAQFQAEAAQAGFDFAEISGLDEASIYDFYLQAAQEPALNSPIPIPEFVGAVEGAGQQWTDCVAQSAVKDPGKYLSQFQALGFGDLFNAMKNHLWASGPIPDMAFFQLFRKVHTREQAVKALSLLQEDRVNRLNRGVSGEYSEVTSSAVFGALNRAGGDDFVVAAAESASTIGLTLSRSSMYHLMKRYSVKGKVEHVEKLFRALETAGKSWNSNCIVIMMLAYFNQGKFEEADRLRNELRLRGIKISERIDSRLDKLLSGEEHWKWEDKVYARPRQSESATPRIPRDFGNVLHPSCLAPPGLFSSPYISNTVSQDAYHSSAPAGQPLEAEECVHELVGTPDSEDAELSSCGSRVEDAIKEPKIHLNVLRVVCFDDLYNAIEKAVNEQGAVENVVISFLFRKVENRQQVEKALALLSLEQEARKRVGMPEEYNETTCSRIFNALFRVGATDVALMLAESAATNGLILSGKALHELLKSFAMRNEVDRVEEIWKLVKLHAKPSSRIVYSIFRTYFDNNMMEKARAFREEIKEMGINLSASATRNIEEVLSGAKQWVKDPHAPGDIDADLD